MGIWLFAAVQTCVQTLRNSQSEKLHKALQREADAQAQCYASQDLREGVSAVAQKRTPQFTGK